MSALGFRGINESFEHPQSDPAERMRAMHYLNENLPEGHEFACPKCDSSERLGFNDDCNRAECLCGWSKTEVTPHALSKCLKIVPKKAPPV